MSRRLPAVELAWVRRMARARGGVLLSHGVLGPTVKLRFRCAAGHEWTQSARKLEIGKWCIACAKARKHEGQKAVAEARLRRVVARHAGVILTRPYEGTLYAMRFRCAEGHEWSAIPKAVLRGAWCQTCGRMQGRELERRLRQTHRRFLAILKKRGAAVLAPGFVSGNQHVLIHCGQGHVWRALPNVILAESWCPSCKDDALLARMRELAREQGGDCLSAKCTNQMTSLEWRCAQGHRLRATGMTVRAGAWCARCRSNRGSTDRGIETMTQIASDRGGRCLSPTYRGAKTKLRWSCQDGHVWAAEPARVLQGSWCPACSRKKRWFRKRLTIADMRQVALERGGACLTKKYHGAGVQLRWRCARGHVWDARPWQVRQGHWCPFCSQRYPGTLDGMRVVASERLGKCLARRWTDHREPVLFECHRGHRFRLLSVVAKTGVWCPVCRAEKRRLPLAASPAARAPTHGAGATPRARSH